MTKEQSALLQRLDRFLDDIPVQNIVEQMAASTDAETVTSMLDTYANESRVSLALIINELDKDKRILEVGAGLCFTALFLKSEAYHITALEPAIGGFGMFEQLKNAILAHHSALGLNVVAEPAQQLDRENHGAFDLIFSNNVMEHIPQWQSALTAMANVLSEQGKMVHACPNYSVPYEPHYGIPVFRRMPRLSRRLFLAADADPEIWESLNFITCKNIRSFCKQHGLSYYFHRELLYKALKRIDDDPLFKQRHQGLIASIAAFVMSSGLGNLFRYIPPAMATPMIVEICRQPELENH